jgi:hypothetical protein
MKLLDSTIQLNSLQRARGVLVEVGIIVFLFYSTLLMREFAHASQEVTLIFAIKDIVTPINLAVGIISGLISCIFFEYLRKQS